MLSDAKLPPPREVIRSYDPKLIRPLTLCDDGTKKPKQRKWESLSLFSFLLSPLGGSWCRHVESEFLSPASYDGVKPLPALSSSLSTDRPQEDLRQWGVTVAMATASVHVAGVSRTSPLHFSISFLPISFFSSISLRIQNPNLATCICVWYRSLYRTLYRYQHRPRKSIWLWLKCHHPTIRFKWISPLFEFINFSPPSDRDTIPESDVKSSDEKMWIYSHPMNPRVRIFLPFNRSWSFQVELREHRVERT